MKLRYDYKCKKCDKVYEMLHSITENPTFNCPECGEQLMRVVTGGGGVVFKGFWPGKMSRRGDPKYDPPINTSG